MFSNKEDKGTILLIAIMITIVTIKNYNNLTSTINSKAESILEDNEQILKTTTLNSLLTDSTVQVIIKTNNLYAKNKTRNTINRKVGRKKTKATIFFFDPNNISRDSIITLGFSSRVAYNWTKYLEKGGHFYSKKDLLKIYGIDKALFTKIKKYIIFQNKKKEIAKVTKCEKNEKNKTYFIKDTSFTKLTHNNIKIEINTCEAKNLIALRGIGQILSKRIIKFRDKLGGFASINQLKEVYGLPPETFESIKGNIYIDTSKIKRLKINIEDKGSLKDFPYISYRLAAQIIKYRKQHGYFKNKSDLLKIKSLDSLKFRKIEPYLDYAIN